MPPSHFFCGALKQQGAAACGVLPFSALTPYMSGRARERALSLCPGARSVLAADFPYFAGETKGNLSVYARGTDYHIAVAARLQRACDLFRAAFPDCCFVPGVDNSPLPEKTAARLSGIGMLGQNTLILCPPYGSYIFLGTILTDLLLDPERRRESPPCPGCGRCVSACPTGALSRMEGRTVLNQNLCVSRLTQKKGQLTPEEEQILARHPYLWGCDLCQTICPLNQNAKPSPLPELAGKDDAAPYLASLTPQLILPLGQAEFQNRFGSRAFAWRGVAVLKRNIVLHKKASRFPY